MNKQQLKDLLEDLEYAEIRQRAMKIQLKMLGTHLESIKEKLRHIVEEDKKCQEQTQNQVE